MNEKNIEIPFRRRNSISPHWVCLLKIVYWNNNSIGKEKKKKDLRMNRFFYDKDFITIE